MEKRYSSRKFFRKDTHSNRQADNLLFSKINAVIASQCAHWRGNPPVEWDQVAITAKNRNSPRFRVLFGTFSL